LGKLFPPTWETSKNYLGVEVIFARSPQGKGRVERKFKMLQDRGIKEVELAEIKTSGEAQKFFDR
jgi:hypothetical protein